ncbi:MAG: OmpA family protein [bacterium]|nr:OmpA family protein [bacterium]
MRPILKLFAILALTAGLASAQPTGSPVSVTIRAVDALTGAMVEAGLAFSGPQAEAAQTTGAGQFILPAGEYKALATAAEYFDRSFDISLAGQDTAAYQVRMVKKGSLMKVEVSWSAPHKAMVKKARIEDLARILLENPQTRVKVTAYLDRDGGRKMNQKLANERADAIRAALVRADIDAARVETEGRLVAVKGKTKALREANNRVEATFVE